MSRHVTAGSTNVSVVIRIIDSGDGTPENGVTSATGGLDLEYRREGAVSTDITESDLSALTDAHSDGGMLLIGNGYYRLDLPDAAVAAGVDGVLVHGTATGMVVIGEYLQLGGVDVTAVSGDTTAADNLELQYDTTGLTGDTFPATQAQLGALSNVGAATNFSAKASPNGFVITTGSGEANNEDSTVALDGTDHTLGDTAGTIDAYYEFSVGAGTPSSVTFTGHVNGNNDDVQIYGWNWITSAWAQIGQWDGKASTANEVQTFDLFTSMVGTGANLGDVRVRYAATGLTSATVNVDQVFVSGNLGAAIYDDGAVWFDSNASNTGTVSGIDGVSTNPVSTVGAMNTLLSNLNLARVRVAPNSTMTLAASQNNQAFIGDGWTLALGTQDIGGSKFMGAAVTGVGSGSTEVEFEDCKIGAATLPPGRFVRCGIGVGDGEFTAAVGSGQYVFVDCYSVVAGDGTPDFNFAPVTGASGINNRGWRGGSSYTLDSNCTLSHEVIAGGGTTITTGGADCEVRGITRSLTVTMSAAEKVQFVGVTGPVTLSGTTTGTVNLYGVSASVSDTTSAATVTDRTVKGPDRLTKGVAVTDFQFRMVKSSDHVTPATGLTITGEISKDGGAFAALTNAEAEISDGFYKVTLTAAEMNADTVALRFSAPGADEVGVTIFTQPT